MLGVGFEILALRRNLHQKVIGHDGRSATLSDGDTGSKELLVPEDSGLGDSKDPRDGRE
jgi:hypothetical protein